MTTPALKAPGAPTPATGLSRNLSIYLDLMRLVASVYVVLGHSQTFFFKDYRLNILFGHARESVLVFFVLSGLVISFVATTKERTWREYTRSRLARIYSVVIPTLVITFVLDQVGHHINPEFYNSLSFFQPESIPALLSYLTFTNQFWISHVVFGTDEPFWSLGYEVWYYVFFGLVFFLPRPWNFVLGLVWALAVGPLIAAYLPVWLLGVLYYRLHSTRPAFFSQRVSLVVFIGTFLVYTLVRHTFGRIAVEGMYHFSSVSGQFITWAYLSTVGVIVLVHIGAFDGMVGRIGSVFSSRATTIIRWAAGRSFTLYLAHLPMMIFICAVFPAVQHNLAYGIAAMVVIFVAVAALSEIGEQRKKWYHAIVTRFV